MWEWQRWKLVLVVWIFRILCILEDRIQHLHAIRIQKPDIINKRLQILDREPTSRKDQCTHTATPRAVNAPREKPSKIISSPGS